MPTCSRRPGACTAEADDQAALLALLLGLQNLPEGFNAFRELHAIGIRSARRTLMIMGSLVAIGPVAGLVGYFLHRAVGADGLREPAW